MYNDNVIQGGIKDNLCRKFSDVAQKLNDKVSCILILLLFKKFIIVCIFYGIFIQNIEDLWTMVSSMCNVSLTAGKDILAVRMSKAMQNAFINQARQYLEKK